MWSNNNDDGNNSTSRGFWTPPASWRSQQSPKVAMMPMSERKERVSHPSCKRDLFHVVHKVPAGDSPYVRAKHVQLIEKDPSKAVSLFWAAINAGDRVDSALKDMAVVMKQLDRADEAIKSFRHLCPCDSQESIDNVLVELYKGSGADTSRSKSLGQDRILKSRRKSWADMVEEEEEEEGEEQELFTADLGQGFNSWNYEEVFLLMKI